MPLYQDFWKNFIRSNETDWCHALRELLRLPTVSGSDDPAEQREWADLIARGFDQLDSLARGMGFTTRNYDNRVLVIEMPGPSNAPVLGFPIHLDVVPAGEGWTYEPFGGEIAGETMYGRGAQDDKGPIVQVLYGLKAAAEISRETHQNFKQTVRIIVVSEEELGVWDDIPFYFQREPAPDFAIVPDAYFPITNGEKGFVNLEVNIAWTEALDGRFEITSGERSNVVPAKATAKLSGKHVAGVDDLSAFLAEGLKNPPAQPQAEERNEDWILDFFGTGAHASLPHKGYNAAADMVSRIGQLPALQKHQAAGVLQWLGSAGHSTDGDFIGIKHEHAKVGKTTACLSILRVDQNGIKATINVRHAIGQTISEVRDTVLAELKAAIGTDGFSTLEIEPGAGSREPIYVDPDECSQWLDPMREAYADVTGHEAGLESIGGTTFAKAFPRAVCFGPVDRNEDEELAHQPDECVSLKAMRRNVEIYGRTITGICLR